MVQVAIKAYKVNKMNISPMSIHFTRPPVSHTNKAEIYGPLLVTTSALQHDAPYVEHTQSQNIDAYVTIAENTKVRAGHSIVSVHSFIFDIKSITCSNRC